jgi:hypothetical protein
VNKSESIANLAVALSNAQKEMPHVKFDAKNPFLLNKYASLGAIIDASVPVMNRYGLSIAQFPTSPEPQIGIPDHIGVRTILMHISGEYIEEAVYIAPQVTKGLSANQAGGVSLTYLRRYAWAAVLGLVADEDTDGDDNPASKENSQAHDAVTQVMSRQWSQEQTEAVSIAALDAGLEPLSAQDAAEVLDFSTLPEKAPLGTVKSWFKYYLKSTGTSPIVKAADANEAYQKAKSK